MNTHTIIQARLSNNLLLAGGNSVKEVLNQTLGIQAQYANHGLFNLINRLKFPSIDTSLLIGWGQRNTIHYYTFEIWQAISELLSEQLPWPSTWDQRELIWARTSDLRHYLLEKPGSTREVLRPLFGSEWKALTNWSAIFLDNSRRGQLYLNRPSLTDTQQHFYWLDRSPLLSPDITLKQKMLTAYLNAYGPASLLDASHFFGVKQSFFRDVDLDYPAFILGSKAYYYTQLDREYAIPEVILLGKFDPLLIAYKNKHLFFNAKNHPHIWRSAGQISALVLIDGQFAGIWRYNQQGKGMNFTVTTLKPLLKRQKNKIEQKFEVFATLLGKTIKQVTYDKLA